MRRIITLLVGLSFLAVSIATAQDEVTDDNSAFFKGQNQSYVFYAPPGCQLLIEEPGFEGYSFAYVPEGQKFENSDFLVTITIYTLYVDDFAGVLESDTIAMHQHYGKTAQIQRVDSLTNKPIKKLRTFALTDTEGFLPTQMVSYFDGGDEIVIFEANASSSKYVEKALSTFENLLTGFRTLPRKELSQETGK